MFVYVLYPDSDGFLVCFSMVVTRGLGSSDPERPSASDDEICRIVAAKVAAMIRGAILEMFGYIKTTLIETFDERYDSVTEAVAATTTTVVVVARPQRGDLLWY